MNYSIPDFSHEAHEFITNGERRVDERQPYILESRPSFAPLLPEELSCGGKRV